MLRVHPERFAFVLVLVDAVLVLVHVVTQIDLVGGEPIVTPHWVFNLDAEVSFGTSWQQIQLAMAGLVSLCLRAARLSSAPQTELRLWSGLAGLLLFLSFDEGVGLHELFGLPTRSALGIESGPLLFAWIIPGAFAVAVVVVAMWRSWWGLPSGPRLLLGLGAGVFVLGALGLEVVGGAYKSAHGVDSGFASLVAVEEGMEMLGASIVIYGLLVMARIARVSAGTPMTLEAVGRRWT